MTLSTDEGRLTFADTRGAAPATTPSQPPGFGRFQIIVLDAFTNRPIPAACVMIGTQSCNPSQPAADANGVWAADVPATSQTTLWDI